MIGFMIIGGIINSKLKSTFKKYSNISTSSGLSGKEIAEKMLSDNNISDVKVINNEGVILNEYKAAQINDS